MSKIKNGDLLIGRVGYSGDKRRKAAWVFSDGALLALNPLCKTVGMKATAKLPYFALGHEVQAVTNDINILREHVVPFYTTL